MTYVFISIVLVTILLGYLYSRHKRKVVAEVRAAVIERATPVSATIIPPRPERTRPIPPAIPISRCKVCGRRLLSPGEFCAVHVGKP